MISPNEPAAAPSPRPRPRATKPKGFLDEMDQPVVNLSSPQRVFEVVRMGNELLAAIIVPLPLGKGDYAFVQCLGQENWRACDDLAKKWKVWAVIADPAWAHAAQTWDRPTGTRLAFV